MNKDHNHTFEVDRDCVYKYEIFSIFTLLPKGHTKNE